MATLKPTTPLRAPEQQPLKPPSPLLAPNRGALKPASPLHPKNAPKTLISHPQRRWRFQLRLGRRPQRRRRFQTTGPAGLQGLAAAPVDGSRAWPGFETMCQTTPQQRRHRWCGGHRRDRRARAGFEAGPGCGARGRQQSLAGLRDDVPDHTPATQAPLVWRDRRARAGFEAGPGCGARGRQTSLAGLRDDAPSRRLAARTAREQAAARGCIKQPGPRDRPHGARNTRGATSKPSSAGH